MKTVQNIFSFLLMGSCALTVTAAEKISVNINNPASSDRIGEVVEISGKSITPLFGKTIKVTDNSGRVLPSQFTYDKKLLVFGDFPAMKETPLTITVDDNGPSVAVDTICVAQIRHDKQDDFTWENDRCGYRLYGPSYRNGGGKVSGYDIWTKSVPYPVLKQRYDDHANFGMSYHKDFGSGMDVYTVGRTLGAGMNALMDNDSICYPCAYEKCEFLDNGPLRVTAKITCYPESIGEDNGVIETRTITLDRGSWLNRTKVTYTGLSKPHPITTGIVVHRQNRKAYSIDPEKRCLAYVDLTDNPANGNGAIFIGIVNQTLPDSISYVPLTPEVGDAIGQVQTFADYVPGEDYTYYWGAGWSKGGVKGMEAWLDTLKKSYENIQHPLEVRIEE